MKININSNEKGFTIVEMLIAAAIMVVVVLGGVAAYNHFRSQTVVEISKMDDISQFNLLTKDLITFSEGAGISTFYLNLPIKTTSCTDDLPCVRQLDNKNFVTPTGSMPAELSGKDCIQFYKDAEGKLESKLAFPGKPALIDKIWDNPEIDLASMTRELYATWVLKDATSPSFLMMKTRDNSVHLSLLRNNNLQKSRKENQASNNVLYAAFESDSDVDVIKNLKGYPFLIYNSTFISHYTIQFAEDIIDCKTKWTTCKQYVMEIGASTSPFYNGLNQSNLGPSIGAFATDKVYFIKFSPIDFTQPFFQNIYSGNNLPADCKTSWGEGLQPSSQYLFPTKALSVSEITLSASDLYPPTPVNVLHLNHYYVDKPVSSDKKLMVALPIDIITFKIEQASESDPKNLVTELWHHTEIKKKTKIYNLKSPFILTRKLGSQELGIWYNPLQRN